MIEGGRGGSPESHASPDAVAGLDARALPGLEIAYSDCTKETPQIGRARLHSPPPMKDKQAAEIAKALSHPLRLELLRALRDRRTLSPVEYSRESGEPLGNVSYHIKALLSAEVIAVAKEVPRRGAVEHFYSLSGKRAGTALGVLDLLATA
jgi:DNA-binding transcriptional ArsR family regulator